MMIMKLLAVLMPPAIYHGCSTWKTFWDKKFTYEEKFTVGEFTAMNMKHCGRHIVRKYREIKDSDKFITLDI